MIIRVFRAIVHDGKQAEFEKFFVGKALPMIQSYTGVKSVTIGTPSEVSPNEFTMIMVWESVDALREFAGDEWHTAVIDPNEAHLLRETFVHHYHTISP